jgi:hypothetical protein
MSQPRSNHQRERAEQESDAQHGRDVDFAGVDVTEPELSVYLPHVFLLLAAASSDDLTIRAVSRFTHACAMRIGVMSCGGYCVSSVSPED